MGQSDYFLSGAWNFFCDLCGAKKKSTEGTKTWDGFWVCKHHKEVRNPQDFLRGVKDDQSVPWSRPEPADTFAGIHYERTVPTDGIDVSDSPPFAVTGRIIPAGMYATLLPVWTQQADSSALGASPINAGPVNAQAAFYTYLPYWGGDGSSEAVAITDLCVPVTGQGASDAVGVAESLSISFSSTFEEAVQTNDIAASGRLFSLTDPTTPSDAVSVMAYPTIAESAATADLLSSVFATNLSTTVIAAEAPALTIFTLAQLNGRAINGAALNAN